MKKIFLNALLLLSILNIQWAQSQNSNDAAWEALIKNDREKALNLVKAFKNDKTNIEQLVLKQLVKTENGIYKVDKNFVPNFIAQKDYEFFLFSLWNEEYIFKNYLSQSFDVDIINNVNLFTKKPIKDQTISAGLTYLDGIVKRYQNDFDSQRKNDNSLLAVKNWQYCGVFENLNNSGIDTEYAPEKIAFSETAFNSNSNGLINWFTPTNNLTSAYQFMSNFGEYGNGINYVQSFFNLDEQQTFIFKLGIGKATKMWVNDVLVFEETEDHITELDGHSIKITVPKGNNRILIKTSNSSYSYFILRLFNENNELLNPKDVGITSTYSQYNKSTKTQLNATVLPNHIETFFQNLSTSTYSTYFKDYLLIKTYLRNSKEKEAKTIINKYLDKNPKSSFFRELSVICYSIEKDYTKVKEINENIKNDDPTNFSVLMNEIADSKKLFKLSVDKMNERLDVIANSTDLLVVKKSAELFKIIRKEDKKAFKKALDEVYSIAKKQKNQKLMSTYATPYASMFNDEKKTMELLLDINKNYFSYPAHNSLIYKYKKLNKTKEVFNLHKDFITKFPEEIDVVKTMVKALHKHERYKESLKYIDDALKNFPYSFTFMRLKGDALVQLNKEKEALKYYKKSFSHDSGNASLRTKIQDLEKQDNPIKKVVLKEPYKYIAKHRGQKEGDNNYGLNVVLDEKNVQVFKEGGNKTHSIYIYEITSDEGIETLKEYNLGLGYGYTINKSEIVKPNGKIVPAERSGSSFVFNSLSIGDIVYIDFETNSNNTGRFYKDFSDSYQIGSFYPAFSTIYRLILPKGQTINSEITNGEVVFKKKSIGNFEMYEWTKTNGKVLPTYESYMPEDCDVATILHLSSIQNWNEISNWYSDLVRTQVKYNSTVDNLFTELFPNGFQNLSDTEKAKKIYYYMMNNLTYSFVNFKQSGFVPQKPSKTITTKLGDCKDFSTLYMALAKKADLETNLVLVSTSDLGKNSLVLPSTDFNHCIVRVKMNNKEHYIELTNKFLPFGSTPNSLIGALALNIPFNSSDSNTNSLFVLNETSKTDNKRVLDINMTIANDSQHIEIINNSINTNAYYRELLDQKNSIELKKQLEELYENKSKLDLSLVNYTIDKNIKEDAEVIFTTNFTINNEMKKIGNMKLLKLPRLSKPYTNDIIGLDKRNYTLVYNKYEKIDSYISNYSINLKDNQKFTEVPENVNLTFKNHQFTILYTLDSTKTNLKVTFTAIIDKSDILPTEYIAYKKFVKQVLDKSEALIGFK